MRWGSRAPRGARGETGRLTYDAQTTRLRHGIGADGARATDDRGIIERRMLAADLEMSHYHDAEYLVINEDFNRALYDLECIVHSQGMTLARQKVKNKALIASIPEEMV